MIVLLALPTPEYWPPGMETHNVEPQEGVALNRLEQLELSMGLYFIKSTTFMLLAVAIETHVSLPFAT